jgi:hypothetical protein
MKGSWSQETPNLRILGFERDRHFGNFWILYNDSNIGGHSASTTSGSFLITELPWNLRNPGLW